MLSICRKITRDYALELTLLFKYRSYEEGIDFISADILWSRYLADHNPSFLLRIAVFNITLIELDIYYIHHRDDLEEDI